MKTKTRKAKAKGPKIKGPKIIVRGVLWGMLAAKNEGQAISEFDTLEEALAWLEKVEPGLKQLATFDGELMFLDGNQNLVAMVKATIRSPKP